MLRVRLWSAALVAAGVVCCLAATSALASGAGSKMVPTVALFDMNRSLILTVTSADAHVDFGHRSLFESMFEPTPSVSVASLTLLEAEGRSANRIYEFLTVPYCVADPETASECDLSGHILYVMLRFRHRYETSFEAAVWQDALPTTATQKALQEFKAAMPSAGVVYPATRGSMRMEDSATCSDLTDECYLSRSATYTSSYKNIDLANHSARFLFRLGERYSMNSPVRLRLRNSLPHDAETTVDVVLVLTRRPTTNLLNRRWWIENVGGRLSLLLASVVATFGFLTVVCEVGALLARSRVAGDAHAATPLYSEDAEDGAFAFLQRVAKVTANAVQRGAVCVWSRVRTFTCVSAGIARYRHWRDTRRHRVPTSDQPAEADREIAALNAPFSEDEETAPTCRICRCSEPREDLFAPCACNGSSKLVHHRCLEQWREMTSNPEHRRVCAECKTPYTLVRVAVPQNPDLVTGSPIIEPVVRHYATQTLYIALTACFAGGGAYCLKLVFFATTVGDTGIDWRFNQGYHWVLTVYFLIALAVNMNVMEPFVKDIESAEVQLLMVFLSLAFIEVPLSYGMAAFLSIIFDRLMTWEVAYGVGLATTALLHLLDVFAGFYDVLSSFSEEREVVAPRQEPATTAAAAEVPATGADQVPV